MTSAYGISPGLRRELTDCLRFWQLWTRPLNNDRETPLVVKWRRQEYVLIAIPYERYVNEVTDPLQEESA